MERSLGIGTMLLATLLASACASDSVRDSAANASSSAPGAAAPKVKPAEARVHFATNSSDLRPDDRALLDRWGAYLAGNAQVKVVLEGHCDERGTDEYNLALGERRARTVRDYLVGVGVSPSQITVTSKGETAALESGSPRAWRQNRRVEIVAG